MREERREQSIAEFVVQTKQPLNLESLRSKFAQIPGTKDAEVSELFPSSEGSLARFAHVRFPHADPELKSSPFDFAYLLADAADLASSEPTYFLVPPPEFPSWRSSELGPGNAGPTPPSDPEWHLDKMGVKNAWSMSKGKDIKVAQVDTGVTDHPALMEVASQGGWNLLEPPGFPWDPLTGEFPGHGTAVAGVVAGRGKGGSKLVRGVAIEGFVYPVRATTSVLLSFSNVDNIAKAIKGSTGPVVSLSLGGIYYQVVEQAINQVTEEGRICVAAAGNFKGGWGWVVFPAWMGNCVCVAGSTHQDWPWDNSCNGHQVTISAPASWIYVAWRSKPSDAKDLVAASAGGTSYSTAAVAGIAALWIGYHGYNNLVQKYGAKNLTSVFKHLLRTTARTPAGWNSKNYGPGIVDAEKLLKHPLPVLAELPPQPSDAEVFERRVRETLRHRDDGESLASTVDSAFVRRYGQELLLLDMYRTAAEYEGSGPALGPSAALRSALASVRDSLAQGR